MINRSERRNEMPAQAPEARCRNFSEVALGYSEAQAQDEARRCLQCKAKPCVAGCPVQVDIPGFIGHIAQGDANAAYRILSRTNALPAVCGRVCPQESQCESHCVRGRKGEPVAIGRLERYAADHGVPAAREARPAANGHRVAMVGSGPASLACAGDLARLGYGVTIYEALHEPGGVLVYGIPEFRLPKAIVAREIARLKDLGVTLAANTVVGRTISVDELMEEGCEAVFIGSGAGLPKFLGIPGETLKGVYSANEFLTRVNLMRAYEADADTPIQRGARVAVVGGGNVAMDAARCARRLGAEVTVLYRRTEAELPARLEEIEHAKEEGIAFRFLVNPISIQGDENGWTRSLTCQRMALGAPDASGRARPEPVAGSEAEIAADCVIVAVGTSPNPLIRATTRGLEAQRWGGLVADEDGQTSRKGVYAGGDAVTGAATVILAMGAGKRAAAAIHRALGGGGAQA